MANAWNPKTIKLGVPFRVTAGGAKYMKIRIDGGSGTYALETSADGGTTWEAHPDLGVMAINAGHAHSVDTTTSAPYLLSGLARITGAAGATIYVVQED